MCTPTNAPTDLGLTDLGLTDKGHACGCGTEHHASASSSAAEMGSPSASMEHYLVEGMTCGHCVSSVTEELSAIDGVASVSVDLNPGAASRVMVVSAQPVPVDKIRTAVTEAGYTLSV